MKSPTDMIETERLRVRRFTLDDREPLFSLHSNPEVMRYIGGVLDREKSFDVLQRRMIAYYDENPGLGMWATVERSSGDFIGIHLLNHIQGETLIQVGYLLFPQFWGKGYATEMAKGLLRYGFTRLELPRIHGITDMPNVESQHVLRKAGMTRKADRAFAHPAYAPQGPLAYFECDADDWLPNNP